MDFTSEQVGELMGVSRFTIYKLADCGALKAHLPTSYWATRKCRRFTRKAVRDYYENQGIEFDPVTLKVVKGGDDVRI